MSAHLKPEKDVIRKMQQADLSDVHAIERVAYEFGWSRGIFRDCLAHGHECWVLEHGRDIIGYAVVAIQVDEAHLLNLCVAQQWQGCGHGQRLLRRMIDVARWHLVDRMLLEVRPSNPAAVHVYRRHGFAVIGKRPRYYPAREGREDALVMALQVRPRRLGD